MHRKILYSILGSAALLTFGTTAHAASGACFQASDLRDWSAPNDQTLYLRIRESDYYRVDLTAAVKQLRSTTARLSVTGRGLDRVCDPADLELKLTLSRELLLPLGVEGLTKLSSDDLAAVSATDLPGRHYSARSPRN